jgi:acetolactate synthase-1/3 small subunit
MMERQTLVALLENRVGTLDRVTGVLRRRRFEVRSLSVGETVGTQLRRMTLTLVGDGADARRAANHLAKLADVVHVELLTDQPAVQRDLAMFKLAYGPTTLGVINALCEPFRGRVLDVSPESVIVEVTGGPDKIDRFRDLLEPLGILEMVRSECVAMGRGAHRLGESAQGESSQEAAVGKPEQTPKLIPNRSTN